VTRQRYLLVTADDYGIGPATSQGIRDLAAAGLVTSSVLLVTSPYAAEAVGAWRTAGKPFELGWHPCLTLDRPVAAPDRVASLLDETGRFWSLGHFLLRLRLRRIRASEIKVELRAQYQRFTELVSRPPMVVNSHHHVQVFSPVGAILRNILSEQKPLPYLRRVREPWRALFRVPGARMKRAVLTVLGCTDAKRQAQEGFPGNDWLAGITDPPCVANKQFLVRWLTHMPGRVVELTCHPGHLDQTLVGRDCGPDDAQLHRRPLELALFKDPSFPEACRRAGFVLVAPGELRSSALRFSAHAA
jgi:predicted glycoside hydrolase/deacetylase ChbG (UPF0249 family)